MKKMGVNIVCSLGASSANASSPRRERILEHKVSTAEKTHAAGGRNIQEVLKIAII